MLKEYLKNISKIAKPGDAREESYYSILAGLLNQYAESAGKKTVHITTLPKKTEAGNPDFRVWDGKQHIVGYIEAKAPTIENLDHIEHSEQLKRYRHTFPNLILTNFFEFRLYRDGVLIDKVLIARPFIAHQLKTVPPVEKESEFLKLLEKFFSFSLPKVHSARSLAVELAKRTRFLRDEVVGLELEEAEKHRSGFILGFYEAFKKYLISGLSKEEFADLYSQTITYGLFAARTRSADGFNRKLAYDHIPRTIGILRDVFRFVSLEDLPQQMEWVVDDISEVLAVTDVKKILHTYFHEGRGKDPIVHFYETFLAEYDPKTREKRGVYYTPEPVVSYIVRSLHHILKEQFNRSDGFASESVTVLDPAAGTLTFLAEATKLAVKEFVANYGEGGKENFIKEYTLENFYAFELMMSPYAVGHLKMSFLLEELGYSLEKDDRFKLYLTNTLEMEDLEQTELPGMASLSEESHLAGKVKKKQPILVILGNPPYSGMSANKSEKQVTFKKGDNYTSHYEIKKVKNRFDLIPVTKKATKEIIKKQKTWIGALIEYYKIIDGEWLKEKNPKWLQDDYVKFIRFAQWKIDQAGEGVLGFITNHSYLDNPTFRGMRQSLTKSFNEIYILDLHGNSLKKEKCPDGSKDENVFDIRQGVAITLFVKKQGKKGCKVFHSEKWGLRNKKYEWLNKNDIKKTKWKRLAPKSESYFFIPRDERLLQAYERFPKITDIFPVNSVGIVTARDKLTIKWSPHEAWTTVQAFSKMDSELARTAYKLGKDARDWKVELAQKDLLDHGLDKNKIVPILYRPFDIRYTYYTGKSRGFHCMPRPEVMRNLITGENMALITSRLTKGETFKHAQVSSDIVEVICMSPKTSNNGFVFPLYLYAKKDNPKKRSSGSTLMLFEPPAEYASKTPNLSPDIVNHLRKNFGKTPTPEEIFFYVYAILYSNIYRTKYAEFLRSDFPRVPFTKNSGLFSNLADHGKRLARLHLLQSSELNPPIAKFRGKGEGIVEKLRYDSSEKRVYFNQGQYFEGISKEVWEYQIGGYQVCHKWLKDRKGRTLSTDDIKHYCRIATAIQKTIEIQKEIAGIYPEVETDTIEFY
ncbi:MAG: N-6 DNA methylase [Deltaproteobacteria bacterium]|nr:N-6 DNA methylase [Deltaproteobacteria bacterium]